MYGRTITTLAVGMALLGAGPAQADAPTTRSAVCNEAENSWQGEYLVQSDDPPVPAFRRGLQMKVGNGVGLANAAAHSPALALCLSGGGGPF
jgi:hypothetical protein